MFSFVYQSKLNKLKKVLYLSYDGLTDALGQSQILPYIIELSKKNYEFTIISTEKKENYEKRKLQILETIQGFNIDWQPIFYTRKPPVLSTLLDVRKMGKKTLYLHKIKRFDLIHCRSYIASLVGLSMKKRQNTKFIFDMRGFWADERVDGALWNLKNPVFKRVYNFFKKKEKEYLQNADYTISLTENAKNEILSWNLPSQSDIEVIPCCADLSLFDTTKHQPQQENRELVLSYLGSIGTWYMLDEMLDFFKRLLLKYPKATFLFITIENPEVIYQSARQKNISKDRLKIQPAERREVPQMLLESDISIFFIKPLFSKKASSATKMGEILAMGIPIIANRNMGDHEFLQKKYNFGLLVDDFATLDYDKAIEQLETVLDIPKHHLQSCAKEYFDLGRGVDLYQNVYEKVFANS